MCQKLAFLYHSLPYNLRQDHSLNMELADWLDGLANELQESSRLTSPALILQVSCHTWLLVWVLGTWDEVLLLVQQACYHLTISEASPIHTAKPTSEFCCPVHTSQSVSSSATPTWITPSAFSILLPLKNWTPKSRQALLLWIHLWIHHVGVCLWPLCLVGRGRRIVHEFEACLVYIAGSGPARNTLWDFVSKKYKVTPMVVV